MGSLLKAVLFVLVIAGVVVGGLRATCIEFWTVPSDDPRLSTSIVPTLGAGDVLVLWTASQPNYASLVRCPHPEDPARAVVGRILGEPGDKVHIDAAQVTVNARAIRSVRSCTTHQWSVVDPETKETVDLVCEEEEAGGASYERTRTATPLRFGGTTAVEVPANHVYLVSDDRSYPQDSRDFGPVPRAGCRAIALRLWSAEGWFDADRRLALVR